MQNIKSVNTPKASWMSMRSLTRTILGGRMEENISIKYRNFLNSMRNRCTFLSSRFSKMTSKTAQTRASVSWISSTFDVPKDRAGM